MIKICKKWANEVFLFTFSFIIIFSSAFQIWENTSSQIILLKFGSLMLFPRICLFYTQTNSNVTFFGSEEVLVCQFLYSCFLSFCLSFIFLSQYFFKSFYSYIVSRVNKAYATIFLMTKMSFHFIPNKL